MPFFSEDEITDESCEYYSPHDSLGRSQYCAACLGEDHIPTEERGSIGQIKPSGWHTVKYDCVDGKYLYNRCHLIGYQLTGEKANTNNLITGTRYFNMEGMLPYENLIADFILDYGYHVLYRVTPIYEENNLLASGVLLEGYSVKDHGASVMFNTYCYNVQPGIVIDYATGDSYEVQPQEPSTETSVKQNETTNSSNQTKEFTYILNTNTKKFHTPICNSVSGMKDKNKKEVTSTREAIIAQGYEPCKRCNP